MNLPRWVERLRWHHVGLRPDPDMLLTATAGGRYTIGTALLKGETSGTDMNSATGLAFTDGPRITPMDIRAMDHTATMHPTSAATSTRPLSLGSVRHVRKRLATNGRDLQSLDPQHDCDLSMTSMMEPARRLPDRSGQQSRCATLGLGRGIHRVGRQVRRKSVVRRYQVTSTPSFLV